MDGKTDYIIYGTGTRKSMGRSAASIIYTLYIQQADVFLANKDIINLEGGAQESSDWSAPEPWSCTLGLGFSNSDIDM